MPQYSRVLCLGDSETFGARSTHGRTYPQLLEELLNDASPSVPFVCLNHGVNSETSWQIVDRGVNLLLSDPWIKIVCCLMGTNDSKPSVRTPPDLYLAQWKRLLRASRCTDALLIAIETPAIHTMGQPSYDADSSLHIRALNHDLAAWCTEVEVPLVAGLFDMFESRPALLDDGVHPTNEGNAVIAAAVAAKIIEIQTVPRAYQRQQILTTPSMPQPGIPIQ